MSVEQINKQAVEDGVRPLVISTLAKTEIAAVVGRANALFLDCFEMFIGPLERELGVHASHVMGRSHAVSDLVNYYHRIEAVNYTMAHDDGLSKRDLAEADVILVGVSRSGKTPTCLYLAMQFGIRAANYPLTPDDFPTMKLPSELQQFRGRLYGLTIGAKRLQEIREERMKHISNDRRFGKNYATLANCEYEIRRAEALMRPGRNPLPRRDQQIGRGARHHDPAGGEAAAAHLLEGSYRLSAICRTRLEETYRGRSCYVERFGLPWHGYRHHGVRGGKERFRDPASFVPEDDRGIAAQVFLVEGARRVLAHGDDPPLVGARGGDEIHAFVYPQQEVGAHGGAQHARRPGLHGILREQHARYCRGRGRAQHRTQVAGVLQVLDHETGSRPRRAGVGPRRADDTDDAGRRDHRREPGEQ